MEAPTVDLYHSRAQIIYSRCQAVSRVLVYSVCWELLGSLRKPRRRRQRQRQRHHRKIALMSNTMAVYVGYNSSYIFFSLPSSAKQQRKGITIVISELLIGFTVCMRSCDVYQLYASTVLPRSCRVLTSASQRAHAKTK